MLVASLQITPVEANDTLTQSCSVQRSNTGIVLYNEDAHNFCRFQVITSNSSILIMEVLPSNTTSIYLLISRKYSGPEEPCFYRFTMIGIQLEACRVVFIQNDYEIHLQGNVSVGFKEVIVTDESVFLATRCLENELESLQYYTNMSTLPKCSHMKDYQEVVTCEEHFDKDKNHCRLEFLRNCNAILRNREVDFICVDSAILTQKTLLVLYNDIASLDLSENNIIKVEIDAFEQL